MIWFGLALACLGAPRTSSDAPASGDAHAGIPEATEAAVDAPLPAEPAAAPASQPASGSSFFGAPYGVVDGPMIKAGKLHVVARHGGGCQEHTWSLAALDAPPPGATAEPSGLALALMHDGRDDRCRRLLTARLELDLDPWRADLCGGEPLVLWVNATLEQSAGPVAMVVPTQGQLSCPEP